MCGNKYVAIYYSTRDRSNLDQAGLYRIAPDSKVLWKYHCRIDHDFHVMDEGHLMLHCLIDKMVPRLGPELRRNPYFIEIGSDKELLWEWHGEEHIQELIDLCGLEVPIDWPARIGQEVEQIRTWDERLQIRRTTLKRELVSPPLVYGIDKGQHVLPRNVWL